MQEDAPHHQAENVPSLELLTTEELHTLSEQADCGDIEKIIATVHASGLYQKALETFYQYEITQDFCVRDALKDAPTLSQKDEDRLLALWLYDTETARHSLKAEMLMHRVLQTRPKLVEALQNEHVTTDQERLATLLHDVGKAGIPRSVLTNRIDDADAKNILIERLHAKDTNTLEIIQARYGTELSEGEVLAKVDAKEVRPVHLLPVDALITKDDLATLIERGFDVSGKTLLEIIDQHDHFSGTWIKDDHPTEGEIVSCHHHPQEGKHPVASTLLGHTSSIATELIIALDDIEAITSARHYKKAQPMPIALANEIRRNKRGDLSDFVLYHVLTELSQDISPQEADEHPEEMRMIRVFFDSHPEHNKESGT